MKLRQLQENYRSIRCFIGLQTSAVLNLHFTAFTDIRPENFRRTPPPPLIRNAAGYSDPALRPTEIRAVSIFCSNSAIFNIYRAGSLLCIIYVLLYSSGTSVFEITFDLMFKSTPAVFTSKPKCSAVGSYQN